MSKRPSEHESRNRPRKKVYDLRWARFTCSQMFTNLLLSPEDTSQVGTSAIVNDVSKITSWNMSKLGL